MYWGHRRELVGRPAPVSEESGSKIAKPHHIFVHVEAEPLGASIEAPLLPERIPEAYAASTTAWQQVAQRTSDVPEISP